MLFFFFGWLVFFCKCSTTQVEVPGDFRSFIQAAIDDELLFTNNPNELISKLWKAVVEGIGLAIFGNLNIKC